MKSLPTRPRVVLMTADGRRHRYVATCLSRYVDLVGIVVERKPPSIAEPEADTATGGVLARHFAMRDAAEEALLGEPVFPDVGLLEIARGEVNNPDVFGWVRAREPEILALFGTGIVKAPLLDYYDNRVVNMHLGLSPYYRGSATNFWPLVEGRPECVGATIHMAVLQVDAGPILDQVRPDIQPGDRIHDIGTRTIMAGAEHMGQVLASVVSGEVRGQSQRRDIGREYRRRDFSATAVEKAWSNLDTGMIPAYLADKNARDGVYPIVTAVLGHPLGEQA